MTTVTSSSAASKFFGRVPQLLIEQQRFASLVDSLRELAAALDEGASTLSERLEPARLVDELSLVLADHFRSAEGCLRTVAACRLDLLPAVVDMRLDHAALCRSLGDLRLLVADQGRWAELPVRIADLLERLDVHRQGEAALIHGASQTVNVA